MATNQPIRIGAGFFICTLVLNAPATYAEQCKNLGKLTYLGNLDDGSRSIWLSKNLVNSGQKFELQSASGNPFFSDNFDIRSSGLHMSASTNVSNGNGGTHKLFDASGDDLCLMDTQNQKGGIVFPSLPPDGLTPGGVTPPIGTLPPTGLTPTVPGGVTPPIGTLPPTGLTPTVPGGVTPPIGTLPPSTGGGNGGSGVGTGGGSNGGSGGGTGGGNNGGTGEVIPDGNRPSGKDIVNGIIAATTQGGSGALLMRDYTISNRVVNGLFARQKITTAGRFGDERQSLPGANAPQRIATSGQKSDGSPQWDAWADARFFDIKDRRYQLDTDGTLQQAYVGADSLVTSNLVLGLAGAYEGSDLDGYRNYVSTDTDAYVIGPYVGYRVLPSVVLDGWLGYAYQNVDTRIANAKGSYSVNQFFASLNATAQFDFDFIGIQPKLSFYYSHADTDDLKLKVGDLGGNRFGTLTVPINDQDVGLLDQSVEFNHAFAPTQDLLLMPYVRAGGRYAFQRPNDGKILSGDLTLVTSSPWSGNIRGGLRTLVYDQVVIDVGGGYLSLGQGGLDIWEGKLAFQWLF